MDMEIAKMMKAFRNVAIRGCLHPFMCVVLSGRERIGVITKKVNKFRPVTITRAVGPQTATYLGLSWILLPVFRPQVSTCYPRPFRAIILKIILEKDNLRIIFWIILAHQLLPRGGKNSPGDSNPLSLSGAKKKTKNERKSCRQPNFDLFVAKAG